MTGHRPEPPTQLRMFGRGLIKRCPVCGQRNLFRRWFRMIERCPRCGLQFERIAGHWSGDLGINTIVSFSVLFLTLIVGFAVTYPDVPGLLLFCIAVGVAIVMPLVFFPFSKSIWLAIDLMMRPPEPGEVLPEFVPSQHRDES